MFAAIDFETTGTVKGFPNEPWQLGITTFDPEKGTIIEMWETLLRVSPDRPFSPHAPGRWAKIRESLAEAPSIYEIWPQIAMRITGVPLVAHNASTERTLLTKIAPLTRFGPWRDTLKIAKERYGRLEKHNLGDLAEAFSLTGLVQKLLPERTWHDALFDATATALLYSRIA